MRIRFAPLLFLLWTLPAQATDFDFEQGVRRVQQEWYAKNCTTRTNIDPISIEDERDYIDGKRSAERELTNRMREVEIRIICAELTFR